MGRDGQVPPAAELKDVTVLRAKLKQPTDRGAVTPLRRPVPRNRSVSIRLPATPL
jgi:hypothetical protein